MGIVLPTSKDVRDLIVVGKKIAGIETERLEVENFIAHLLGAKPRAYFSSIQYRGVTIKGELTMAELKEGQQFGVSVSLTTKAGHPAAYQAGTALFASSNPAVASVTVDPTNELAATVQGLDGSANTPVLITFTADGDPSADVTANVVATLDVVVTQGNAVVAEIIASAPVAIP